MLRKHNDPRPIHLEAQNMIAVITSMRTVMLGTTEADSTMRGVRNSINDQMGAWCV
jgi:hypothetical protein